MAQQPQVTLDVGLNKIGQPAKSERQAGSQKCIRETAFKPVIL